MKVRKPKSRQTDIGRGIFNPTCVICLGDLLKEQLSMFQKYKI
jgi:hypothetical protein